MWWVVLGIVGSVAVGILVGCAIARMGNVA
jgi:hypothetical protein